jgi:hypothetical protein
MASHSSGLHTIPRSVFVATALAAGQAFIAGGGGPLAVIVAMALVGPIVTIWMVFSVLTSPCPNVTPLGDAEWGYQDRTDLELRSPPFAATPGSSLG